MISTKNIFTSLAFLTLVILSIGFTSAQVLTINPTSISETTSTGDYIITFNLTHNSGSTNQTNLVWNEVTNIGNFTILPTTQEINVGQTISNITATLNIPATSNGVINAVISVTSNTSSSANLPITLTILNEPSFTISTPSNLIIGNNTSLNTTLDLTNTGNVPLSLIFSELTNYGATFSVSPLSISAGLQGTVDVIFSTLSNFDFGLTTVTIQANDTSNNLVSSVDLTIEKSFCDFGGVGNNLTIEDIDWDNLGNGDDNDWELLDEIKLEIEVENHNNDDDVDVVVVLGLFDSNGNDVADDLLFLSNSEGDNEESEFNIDEDEKATTTFRFRVPADFDEGDYRLALKAYSDDFGESLQCTDSVSNNDLNQAFYQDITIDRITEDDRMVVVDDIQINSQATCGDLVTGQFTVFNIGDEDQDRVKILMRNSELGLDQEFEITNLDIGDSETIQFSFEIPSTAENGNTIISFDTIYDYNNGDYREESESTFTGSFEILGCSNQNLSSTGNAIISANLISKAIAGEEFKFEATITNSGTETATYTLSLNGISEWATLKDISSSSIVLNSGESKTITITLDVEADAIGTQLFNLQAKSNEGISTQEIEVNFGEPSIFSFEIGDNKFLWLIAVINVVLILLIFVVAVRLSRR